jgi:hypothetical protein
MKGHTLLLRSYIEDWARAHDGLYPPVGVVAKGEGLDEPLWPASPWSGEPVQAGEARGDFTYEVAGDRRSYTLTAYLGGVAPYVLEGRSPAWPAMTLVCDAAIKNGASLIERFMRDFAGAQGRLPTVAELDPGSAFGMKQADWPLDPFDGGPMQPGLEPGDYTYVPGGNGSYVINGHLTTGTVTRVGPARDWAAPKNELTIQGVTAIGHGIELYALDHAGFYPHPSEVGHWGIVGQLVDPWPKNPYTGAYMELGAGAGDFTYSTLPAGDGYTLLANLAGGATHDVGDWTQVLFEPHHRDRIAFNNLRAQGYAQVLKGYVDKWALVHGGELPTVDQMTPWGAVGQAQTWWPVSAWTGEPMRPGSDRGHYEYTPGGDGTFTLVLHQQPLEPYPGMPSSGYPETYTAQ